VHLTIASSLTLLAMTARAPKQKRRPEGRRFHC
jgi:hypothetical protein